MVVIARLLCDATSLGEGGEIKGKYSGVSPLRGPPTQEPAASSELNCLPFTFAVREHRLVRSAHTRKLSSAHVPSHCNRALL
jgi:hypothetical protein